MSEIDELLKVTEYTQKEYEIYRKVQKHSDLLDLKEILERDLQSGKIGLKEYDRAVAFADEILDTYSENIYREWIQEMRNAINWVIKGE